MLCECDREILAAMNKNSLLAVLKVRIRTGLVEFKIHGPHSGKLFVLQNI